MKDVEMEVIAWHKDQFSWANIDDIQTKLCEELDEFESESFMKEGDLNLFAPDVTEEFVDMCIVYIAGLAKLGLPTLTESIKKKLDINKARKWNKDGTRDR